MLPVANALLELKKEVESRTSTYHIQPDSARHSILMMGGRCEGGSNFNLVPGEFSFTVDRRINPEEDLEVEKQRLFVLLEVSVQMKLNLFLSYGELTSKKSCQTCTMP